MVTIVRGTTPTIKYTFKTVDVANIDTAYLTFKYCGNVILERDITTATTGEDSISWVLDQ